MKTTPVSGRIFRSLMKLFTTIRRVPYNQKRSIITAKKLSDKLLYSCLLAMLVLCMPTSALAQNNIFVEQIAVYDDSDDIVVKVYFSDIKVAQKISKTYEPRESKYEAGYLVLQETKGEIKRLLALSESLNIRLSLDESATLIESQKQQGLWLKSSPRGLSPLIKQDSRGALQSSLAFVGIPGFACYRTVEETFATAQDIVANNPNLASWTDVGDSWEKANGLGGYDMNVLRLTNQSIAGPKPTIFITSSIHAREYTTAELMTRFAENLIANYSIDADITWILDHTDIRLMLVTNPDGRKRAETGILWRKNANQNYCGATSNTRGADLNRNFSFEWNCCNGSSGSQCSTTYRGPFAASEPETQAVINQLSTIFPDARGPNANDAAPLDTSGIYLDIHSSGRLLLWPWGSTNNVAPNGIQLQTLGRKLAFFNGHAPQQSIGLYATDGTTTSYGYGALGLASFTYELGTQFFESCSYFENTLIPDNFPSLMYALKSVRAPYQLPAGPEGVGIKLSPSSSTGVPAGTDVNLEITFDDTRYNNSNGTESTQSVAAAEYYIDVPPWQNGAAGSAVSMFATDGTFNSGVEGVTATIDTSDLSEGRHTVYTRSRDSSGNWGVVSAVFLDIDNDAVLPTLLFADDFESDLGWVTNPNSSDSATTGQWQRANPQQTTSGGTLQLGTTVSGQFDLVTGPLAGSSVGANDIDSGTTSMRSPDIQIPANATGISLSFYSYLAHTSNSSTADFLRLSAVASSSGTVQLFEELGGANQDNGSWEQTTVSLDALAGQSIYLLLEAADAGGGSLVEAGVDDLQITAVIAAGGNLAPTVNAGADQVINLPATTASLDATVTDDGLPSGTINTTWSAVSGPGTVSFADANSVDTTADFTVSGNYVLRLTASDGALTSSDEVQVQVIGSVSCSVEEAFEGGFAGWSNSPASTCSTGTYVVGAPTLVTNSGVVTQLAGDHTTGSGSALFSATNSSAGVNDIDGGECIVESPNYVVSNSSALSVWYFHGQRDSGDDASGDFFNLEISLNGGGSWTSIASNGDQRSEAVWTEATANIPAGSTVRLRMAASDGPAGGDLIEAGLDDLQICE